MNVKEISLITMEVTCTEANVIEYLEIFYDIEDKYCFGVKFNEKLYSLDEFNSAIDIKDDHILIFKIWKLNLDYIVEDPYRDEPLSVKEWLIEVGII